MSGQYIPERHGELGIPGQPESPAALARVAEIVGTIRASVELAQVNPRDEGRCEARVLRAMQHPLMAEAAAYEYKRGRTKVTGPSVKLAREMARCWGNIQHGFKVVSEDEESIHIEGWAWDLETNSRTSKESRFKKLIQRKRGDETVWEKPNERDLNELVMKRAALLQRNALLELLPTYLIDECLAEAERTLSGATAQAHKENPQELIRKTIGAFEPWGITAAQLENFGGPWSAAKVQELRRIYNAVRDGQATLDEYFPAEGGPEMPAAGPAESLDDIPMD